MDQLCLKCGTNLDKYVSSALHWNYRGFWGFPEDLVEDCDHITDIYLKENSISEFPTGLVNFSFLKNLYLSGNNIRTVSEEIQFLTNLTCLDLSGNLLECFPAKIRKLRKLKCLILDDNRIRQIPIGVRRLRRLKYFSICDNNLSWLIQRPVANYYGSEFRCWRNKELTHVPISIWTHLLQNQLRFQLTGPKPPINNPVDIGTKIKVLECKEPSVIYMASRFLDIHKCGATSSPISLLETCLRILDKRYDELVIRNAVDLPHCLYEELQEGPTEFCDTCGKGLFHTCILDISKRSINSQNESSEILVSVVFCSKKCCLLWRSKNSEKLFDWIKIS